MNPRMNKDRAESAHRALKSYVNDVCGNEDDFTAITDLLCDLRHLADERKYDWREIANAAQRHYQEEMEVICPKCGCSSNAEDFPTSEKKSESETFPNFFLCPECKTEFDMRK